MSFAEGAWAFLLACYLTEWMYLFWLGVQVKLAKKLVEKSFADKVFFCNSGTEANEAVIKFARKYARVQGETGVVAPAICSWLALLWRCMCDAKGVLSAFCSWLLLLWRCMCSLARH